MPLPAAAKSISRRWVEEIQSAKHCRTCREPVPSHLMRARSCDVGLLHACPKREALVHCSCGLEHPAERFHSCLRGLAIGDEDQRRRKQCPNLRGRISTTKLQKALVRIRVSHETCPPASRDHRHNGMAFGHGIVSTLAIQHEKMSGMTGHCSNVDASAAPLHEVALFSVGYQLPCYTQLLAFSDSLLRVVISEGTLPNLGRRSTQLRCPSAARSSQEHAVGILAWMPGRIFHCVHHRQRQWDKPVLEAPPVPNTTRFVRDVRISHPCHKALSVQTKDGETFFAQLGLLVLELE